MNTTTAALRQHIFVTAVSEDERNVQIDYTLNGAEKSLLFDKAIDHQFSQFLDGPATQWDAINIVVFYERRNTLREVFDMAQTQGKALN